MSVRGKKVTFDHTLEIIHIILELHSQIPKSAPDEDIMRIIAASKSVDYSAPVPILRPNNAGKYRSALLNLWKGIKELFCTSYQYLVLVSQLSLEELTWSDAIFSN